MKILIPLVSFGRGGGARVLSQFANYWIKAGHQVTFLCRLDSDDPYFPTTASIVKYNIWGSIEEHNSLKKTYKAKSAVILGQFALKKAIEAMGAHYDFILANHSMTAFPVSCAKVSARKFYYIQAYEPEYYLSAGGVLNYLLSLYTRQTYKLANLSKIVNSPIYYSYKEINATRFVFCGLDLNVYYPKPVEQISFNKDVIKIGTIGRIEKHKGTTYVLEAFKQITSKSNQEKKLQLHLAFGHQNYADESQNIFVTSPNGDEELAQFYREMDIVVAAGIVQFGAVHYPVLESMACATPIVTTFYTPAHDANAWLVDPASPNSIVEQINVILNNEEIVRQKVLFALNDVKQFSWDIVANKMLKYFQAGS
jgi:glycosyltransferase involved in cell wall biosynthesis